LTLLAAAKVLPGQLNSEHRMSLQHAVILGGTSGIGLATAHSLLRQGFKVTIAGRDRERLAKAGRMLGNHAATATADATDPGAVNKLFSGVGGFDHLVLAFGSNKGLGPFATLSVEDVRLSFAEKVFPQFACAQAAQQYLSPNGSITFLSAVSAFGAMPGAAGIGSANAAIAALVPTLARELQPLRVNAVAPGVVDTAWWDWCPAEQKSALFADFASKTPVGRVGTAEEIAQAVAFLVTNNFMTGQTIVCDGGIRLS
jgi:NAD(P)-dependent dehydrogenase (short-subunit alcohol dehydrogenase family)